MTIPANVTRAVLHGTARGDIWETGFWIAGATPTSQSEADALATLLWGVLDSESDPPVLPELSSAYLDPNSTIDGIRVYCYPTGGPTAAFIGTFTAPEQLVGSAGGRQASQTCVVVTLQTGAAGRRHRGRMYFPANGLAGDSLGEIPATAGAALVNDLAAAFSDWNTSGDNGVISVVSQVGAGSSRPITSLRADSRYDIQRRRANHQQVHNSWSAAVTTA